ncbi:hypothetical protein BKA70DRAFT_1266042 [Coprinopsis sp. MPI-PUGE-AT-0042]|nr:hypothetical protein BKA70DRAFT_1266042 [Coprinopsis sp. MPI-PUGE-AT-0042]
MKRLFSPKKLDKPSQDAGTENEPDPLSNLDSELTLTGMISYLSATNLEDWSLVLEVCELASLNETNANEAARALRREFKSGQPHVQLAAGKLWAVMLLGSGNIFVSECGERKFLDTLQDLIKSDQIAPVVRDRLLEIVAAAAYASGGQTTGSEKNGFRGLWLRVKPADKPDDGIPFNPEDSMFNPPSSYANGAPSPTVTMQQVGHIAPVGHRPSRARTRIVPYDEDIRRLFQECKMAAGYASVLSEAVLTCTPSSLKSNPIIKEFHTKCENQQKLVCAQIPWATARADHSRAKRNAERERRGEDGDDETVEEKLLGALLGANEELLSALRQHDDLCQILVKKKIREDVSMDRGEIAPHKPQHQTEHLADVGTFRSRSPSPARSVSSSTPLNGSGSDTRAPCNFSLRSEANVSNDDLSNNKQHSWVDGDHGGAHSVASTHTETDGGSYKDHAHNGQQQGIESDSPPLDTREELIDSGRNTPVLNDQLPAIVAGTTDSMTVCLYPSGIAESQIESREGQSLSPTGGRDLDHFFGLSSNASTTEEGSHSEVSGKVAAVLTEASCIEISGGVFNNAGNDIHNYQMDQQVYYYPPPLPPSPQQKEPRKESKSIWSIALLYVGLGVAVVVIPTIILRRVRN